jgi:hypothetical protein
MNYYKEYCDKKINQKLYDNSKKILDSIDSTKMILLNDMDIFNKKSSHIKSSHFYQDCYTYIFVMMINTRCDMELEIFGVIDNKLRKYIYIGCITSHPFVIMNNFKYDPDSDGSGPEFSEKINIVPQRILQKL